MFMGLGMPIPDLSNKPGPGRPGWSAGSYDFQFEVTGAVTIKAQPAATGTFTIKWPNGTEQTTAGSNSIAAPDATAGIVSINKKTDTTYADEFAVVGGQTAVTKVLSWGQNPWTSLSSAFLNCTNLTDISTTTLTTGVNSVLTSAFRSCTSLSSANISSWDMTNAARIDQLFDGCTGLEVFQASSLNLNHTSQLWLRSTGTAVTNGCEYKMSGLNITATSYAASNMLNWWVNMKINPSSSFANISWPSVVHAQARFQGSSITGVNSTLDCSGWTNYNSTSFPSFHTFTATEGGTSNMRINITNLNVSNITSFNRSFLASNVSEIIGLSGLGASAGMTNMEYAFYLCGFLDFSNNNLSNAFINSFSLTSVPVQAFRGVGASLSSGSAPPNLDSLNISGTTGLNQIFQSAKFSSAPDFSNVVMSTTNPYSLNSSFNSMVILDSSNIDSLFAKTFKVSDFASSFSNCQISSITIGNNVDLSTCTNFNRMFVSASTISDVSFPTNADFSGVTTSTNWQYMFDSGPTLSTCQVDNFIRRLHATALSYGLVINFNNAATTEAPSVVSSKVADLEAAGWTITDNTTDATLPFAYPSYSFDSGVTQSVTPTTVPSGAIFSTTSSGVTVNSSTGVVSWDSTFMGTPTIRCTYTDGCYNEVQMSMLITVDNNYSMAFDSASSSYMSTSTFSELDGLTTLSFSAWIKPTSASTSSILSIQDTAGYEQLSIIRHSSGYLIGKIYGGSQTRRTLTASPNIAPLNVWTHIAFTVDLSQPLGSRGKLYINGSNATSSDSTNQATINTSGGGIFIGKRNVISDLYFDGQIDEVSIFNRELTPAQVKLIYNASSTNKSIKLSSLPGGAPVAWYRMGD